MKGTPLNTLPKNPSTQSCARPSASKARRRSRDARGEGGRGARDPVGDSRCEVRARELRGGAGWSLVRGVKPGKAISDLDSFHFF